MISRDREIFDQVGEAIDADHSVFTLDPFGIIWSRYGKTIATWGRDGFRYVGPINLIVIHRISLAHALLDTLTVGTLTLVGL